MKLLIFSIKNDRIVYEFKLYFLCTYNINLFAAYFEVTLG